MNIAYFTDVFTPNVNGIVTSITNSSKALAKKGHKITIFTSDNSIKPSDFENNIFIEKFPSLKMKKWKGAYQFTIPEVATLFMKIKKSNPDIIHIHTPSLIGWQALIYSILFNIPVVTTYHTFIEGFLNHFPFKKNNDSIILEKIMRQYSKIFYNLCGNVIAPSKAIKKYLKKRNYKIKFYTISNGVNTKLFHPIKTKKNGKTILHVGRISKEKNIDVLIKAFAKALKKIPDMNLLIAGQGIYEKRLKKLVKDLKIQKNVSFLGKIAHEDLPELYSKADIFVTASTIETEGLVVLEAMACGLPIVGVKALALLDLIKENYNGLLAEPYNEDELSENIVRLMSDKKLRERFSKNSINASKKYSLDFSIKKIEKLYENLIKGNKKATEEFDPINLVTKTI